MSRGNTIKKETEIKRTPRVMQLEGIFDIPISKKSEVSWDINLPIEDKDWNVGLIVGPSGSGKTTVAKHLFSHNLVEKFNWNRESSVIEDFPENMGIKEITNLLSSVGFNSPPSWLRPFHVLSNGEQFRVTVARALAESDDLVVVDEFTSVIDRQVAQIGSYAVSKAIRNRNKKFIAVSCHYDVIEWLQPDWIYQPHINEFKWRSLRRRPNIKLRIARVHTNAWKLFQGHHYLSKSIIKGSICFCGFINQIPVAFIAVSYFPHRTSHGWRGHRYVSLPDYQGIGLMSKMLIYVASLFISTGRPYRTVTSHPGLIQSQAKSKNWNMIRKPSMVTRHVGLKEKGSAGRLTASFEYVGRPNYEDAKKFGIL